MFDWEVDLPIVAANNPSPIQLTGRGGTCDAGVIHLPHRNRIHRLGVDKNDAAPN